MASPFENQNSWADQWDSKSDLANPPSEHEKQQQSGKMADYNKKIKSAASSGLEKAKVAASSGAKKVKSGTTSSIQWIKEQYQKKTQK